MKQRVMLTDHQAETWVAVLSQFPPTIVNLAVMKVGLSTDPFPDLGKLVLACQQSMPTEYAPGRDTSKVPNSVVRKAAEALQLPVK